MTVFLILCVPGILWAGLKKLLPSNQKSVKGQVVLVSITYWFELYIIVLFSKINLKLSIYVMVNGCTLKWAIVPFPFMS